MGFTKGATREENLVQRGFLWVVLVLQTENTNPVPGGLWYGAGMEPWAAEKLHK